MFVIFLCRVIGTSYITSDDKSYLKISGINENITKEGVANKVDQDSLKSVEIEEGIIEISQSSFLGYSKLTSIILPKGIRFLRNSCFRGCTALKSINVQEGLLEMESEVFHNCISLENVSLPSSVQIIPNDIFLYCCSLAHIFVTKGKVFSSNKDNTILIKNGNMAYLGPAAYSTVQIPDEIQIMCTNFIRHYKNVTTIKFNTAHNLSVIQNEALAFTSIRSIVYPKGVTSLGGYILHGNDVEYVKIPNTLKSFSSNLFSPAPKRVEVEENCSVLYEEEGIIYNGSKDHILAIISAYDSLCIKNTIKKVESSAIRGCTTLTKLSNESNHKVYNTYKNILYNNNKSELVCCPGGVHDIFIDAACKTISQFAFDSLSLTSITFEGNNLKTLSNSALYKVYNLERLDLPEGLQSIGSWSISRADIKSITFPSTLSKISYQAMSRSNFSKLDLGRCVNLTVLDYEIFIECKKVETLILPPQIVNISFSVFNGCVALRGVRFPSSLICIGENCFNGCKSLSNVIFEGENVSEIAPGAFCRCNFSSVKIPKSLKILSQECFAENPALKEVEIGEESQIVELQMSAFRGCHLIEKLEFGPLLQKIPGGSLSEMSSLKTIIISKNNQNYISDDGSVYTRNFSALIVFPNGGTSYKVHQKVHQFGESAFFKCEQLSSIISSKESNLYEIQSKTFFGCISLTSISIASSVKSISSLAFSYCTNLKTVIFERGSNIEVIHSNTFSGCNNLKQVIFDDVSFDEALGYFKDADEFRIRNNVYPKTRELDGETKLKIVEDGSFEGFLSLERFDAPSSLRHIGSRAFAGCENLRAISLFNVQTIGEGAFVRCRKLQYLHFGTQVSLSDESFYGCSGLIQVTYCGNATVDSNSFLSSSLKASVSVWYQGNKFGGLDVFKILDQSCMFPSGRFSAAVGREERLCFLHSLTISSSDD